MSENRSAGLRHCGIFVMTVLLALMLSVSCRTEAHAQTYRSGIEDSASLLTAEEKNDVLAAMEPVTAYCNIAFCSVNDNSYNNAQTYGENELYRLFGRDSDSIVFLIDMDTRKIQIITGGRARRVVTDAYCNTITDNIYQYATKGEYGLCAEKAFEQISRLYKGQWIAQPMRFICAFLLALFIAIVIVFFMIAHETKEKGFTGAEITAGALISSAAAGEAANILLKEYKRTHSSGGSGGSSGGGSGGGGCGGGGHSF